MLGAPTDPVAAAHQMFSLRVLHTHVSKQGEAHQEACLSRLMGTDDHGHRQRAPVAVRQAGTCAGGRLLLAAVSWALAHRALMHSVMAGLVRGPEPGLPDPSLSNSVSRSGCNFAALPEGQASSDVHRMAPGSPHNLLG